VQFVVHSTEYMTAADKHCIALPLLQPFLRLPVTNLTEDQILGALKRPLLKPILDMAFVWATKVEKGVFWKTATRDAVFHISDSSESPNSPRPYSGRFATRISSSQRNSEDDQWLTKLKAQGMAAEDEMKLLALQEYIWRTAHHTTDANPSQVDDKLSSIVPLNLINVTPQTVFFDSANSVGNHTGATDERPIDGEPMRGPHTIAEALLEASTALDGNQSGTATPRLEDRDSLKRRSSSPKPIRPSDKATAASPQQKIGSSPSRTTPFGLLPDSQLAHSSSLNSHKGGASPGNSEGLATRRGSDVSVQKRSTAQHLMRRKDLSKAEAATSTTHENVFAKLNGHSQSRQTASSSPLSMAMETSTARTPVVPVVNNLQPRYTPNHTYSGTDSNVLRLLDSHFSDNYPAEKLFDFGEIIHPLRSTSPIRRVTDSFSDGTETPGAAKPSTHLEMWRPTGHLLTLFSEHTACVNRVVPSPDHAFFVTASDDETCKVWDTLRLEKNLTPRSKQTYRHESGAKVKSLCFIENTHTFASGTDDGGIHLVRVDYQESHTGSSVRYGKLSLVRQYQLPAPQPTTNSNTVEHRPPEQQEFAVWLHHYRSSSSQSVLLLLTNLCRVLALDLKTMDTLYCLTNPVHHGTPTTLCMDRRQQWLLVGTSHGVLDMWDLRWKLLVRSWGLKSCCRIDRLMLHPIKGRGRWIIVSCGGELTVWDIEKVVCREVYRLARPKHTEKSKRTVDKPYDPWYPDEETADQLLTRFASAVSSESANIDLIDPQPRTPTSSPPSKSLLDPVLPISTMYLGVNTLSGDSTKSEPTKAPFLVTGGADQVLRFWDLTQPDSSMIVSSPHGSLGDDDMATLNSPLKARYEVSHPITPLSSAGGAQILLVEEVSPSAASSGATPGTPSSGPSTPMSKRSGKGAGAHGTSNANKPPRNTVISAAQRALLKSHLDGIVDVCVLQRPYGLIVSVDRGGGVYVFQ
jgi:phosphoinositide-3-kinase, regulatory subunit 4